MSAVSDGAVSKMKPSSADVDEEFSSWVIRVKGMVYNYFSCVFDKQGADGDIRINVHGHTHFP